MTEGPLSKISANTGASVAVPLLITSGLVVSLAGGVETPAQILTSGATLQAALIERAAQDSVSRSLDWIEVLRQQALLDVEQDLAPFLPALRVRSAMVHITHRGRGAPLPQSELDY